MGQTNSCQLNNPNIQTIQKNQIRQQRKQKQQTKHRQIHAIIKNYVPIDLPIQRFWQLIIQHGPTSIMHKHKVKYRNDIKFVRTPTKKITQLHEKTLLLVSTTYTKQPTNLPTKKITPTPYTQTTLQLKRKIKNQIIPKTKRKQWTQIIPQL